MFEDATFVETPYQAQAERCVEWVTAAVTAPLLILELGARFNTPGVVRFPLERLAARHGESRLVRINREHPNVPANLDDRAVGIQGDAGEVVSAVGGARERQRTPRDRRRRGSNRGGGSVDQDADQDRHFNEGQT
jgi:hypothetical protein